MNQRKSATGRPVGTDGSDFSYRMVVDSRYTKVAKEKSKLRALIAVQAVFHLIGLVYAYLSTSKEEGPKTLAMSAAAVGLVSLFIGDIGRRKSRVNFLRLYMVFSSVAVVLSVFCAVRDKLLIQKENAGETGGKLEIVDFVRVQLGALVHIFGIITTSSLIPNMSPPKKAS